MYTKLSVKTPMSSTDSPTSRNANYSCCSSPCQARMILSALSPSELINVISTENATLLKTVKGIGLKTAQRVIVDLKDKIKTGSVATGNAGTIGTLVSAANVQVQEEAVAALTMLGFAQAPSQKVVLAILKEEPSAPVEQVIKLALKRL